MMTISVDFDGTIDCPEVLDFIKVLRGSMFKIKIICLTGRHDDCHTDHEWGNNKDLYRILDDLCISKVYFMNGTGKKYEWLKGSNIFLHIDNDTREVKTINKYTGIKAYNINDPGWKDSALKDIIKKIGEKVSKKDLFQQTRTEPF